MKCYISIYDFSIFDVYCTKKFKYRGRTLTNSSRYLIESGVRMIDEKNTKFKERFSKDAHFFK